MFLVYYSGMAKSRTRLQETAAPRERAILVGVKQRGQLLPVEDSLAELARLTETAGAEVVGEFSQALERPNGATFIGSGKVREVAAAVLRHDADLVIFDDELSPTQQDNLERELGAPKVLDRTALILDIFGMRAQTARGACRCVWPKTNTCYPGCAECGATWPLATWAAV
jgi:GTP-binding protein HflX